MILRVRGRATFEALRRARRAKSGPLTVSWIPPKCPGQIAIAFAITKHVGSAVQRNRIRRQLREAARSGGAVPAGTYLIRVAPEASGYTYAELQCHLQEGARRASLVRSGHAPGEAKR